MEVEVVDGDRGEFTVLVDGRAVARKVGESLPAPEEVLAAVREVEPAQASR
jgi:hypothetical protein